jgi:hypothetical protein
MERGCFSSFLHPLNAYDRSSTPLNAYNNNAVRAKLQERKAKREAKKQ